MGEDHGAGRQLEGAAGDLAGIDRRVIDGALVHHLIGDELVLLVEEEHPELFARGPGHGDLGIGQKRGPRADHRPPRRRATAHARGGLMNQLEIQSRGLTHALDGLQLLQARAQHASQAAEAHQESLGQGLEVAARKAAGQQKLQNLIVGHA